MSAIPATCHAVVLSGFGDASRLLFREIATPAIGRPDELLVRVHATGVNPIEWKMREGLGPVRFLGRFFGRRLLGDPMILGFDFSGVVAAAGPSAAGFRVGDEVFGMMPLGGAYSQYLVVRPSNRRTAIAHKPKGIPHERAGVVPFAAVVAYAGLVTYGRLGRGRGNHVARPGPRVLIVGASGGVGHLAVQMAKRGLGASLVVGVCSSRNSAFARRCGADEVIEHDRVGVAEIGPLHPEWHRSFDLLFDTIGVDAYYTLLAPQLLKRGGLFVTAALPPSRPGKAGEDVGLREGFALVARLAWRQAGGRYFMIPGLMGGLPTKDGFRDVVRWLEEGRLSAEVWKTFDLEQIREAQAASQTGAAVGKIAVVVR
jgi:NADPH:quinone reductase-like Zn-dependent oxidoreductase